MRKQLIPLLSLFLFAGLSQVSGQMIGLEKGMVITGNALVKTARYTVESNKEALFTTPPFDPDFQRYQPALIISGENIEINFNMAELASTADPTRPDQFKGIAVLVKGKNIVLQNLRVRGFKIALLADGVENLTLDNCDFSYNFRQKLRSTVEREDFSDWLSHHQNEGDEWLRYGAGIYLKNCQKATVKGCKVTGGQNGLLMTNCQNSTVYNNSFHFNSGLGIGLYRSSSNKIMHNRLDWNVRGYSHGVYQRGQDSAGILAYEQCNDNIFAFNSATHSGDGFFLWAGQHTMDTGEGGCNNNLIYGNDFSHAPTNGVEVTFSKNRIVNNKIEECTYGIWGGYSFESLIFANQITDCKTGIAIEHGQQNTIVQNLFEDDSTAINLWARESQPADWGYAQKRDTRSRDAVVDKNVFLSVRKALKVSNSENIAVNGENLFFDFEKILETPKPNQNLTFYRNEIYGTAEEIGDVWRTPEFKDFQTLNFSHPGLDPENPMKILEIPIKELQEPDSLKEGINPSLTKDFPQGRKFILVDEWGPYDFRRPTLILEAIEGEPRSGHATYNFSLIGPAGVWILEDSEGILESDNTTAGCPMSINIRRDTFHDALYMRFKYLPAYEMTDVFGKRYRQNEPYYFDYQRFEKKLDWNVRFYNYDTLLDPLKNKEAFSRIKRQRFVAEMKVQDLYFAWWDAPAPGVQADRFATVSTTSFDMAPGKYQISLTSDDGVRMLLDGKKVIENWDVHEPETDEITVELGGHHTIEIEHFDASGFSTLDFRIKKVFGQ